MTTTDSAGGEPGPRQPRRPADFDVYYASKPPWDIDRPQTAFVTLADTGRLTGRVLDVGCGTGEHTLLAAGRGLDATGIDTSAAAIEQAQRKAADRGLAARFLLGDALALPALGERFDTVLDCGLFHNFTDEDRVLFTASLHAAMTPGGQYYLLGFSDLVPGDNGPRRLTRDEIRATFTAGWHVDAIELSAIELTRDPGSVPAWLATITRG